MNDWISAYHTVVSWVLGNPRSMLEQWCLVVAGGFVMFLVLNAVANAMRMENVSAARSIVILFLSVAIVLAALTAVRVFVPSATPLMMVGAGAAVSLVVVVPLIAGLDRGGYMAALLVWLIAVAAVAAVILLGGAAFDAFYSGSGAAEGAGQQHKSDLENVLK